MSVTDDFKNLQLTQVEHGDSVVDDEKQFCHSVMCRYKSSHVTSGHCCTKCNKYGHGAGECAQPEKLKALQQYRNDVLPYHLWCSIKGCRFPTVHTNQAHHCRKCKGPHSFDDCPYNSRNFQYEEYFTDEKSGGSNVGHSSSPPPISSFLPIPLSVSSTTPSTTPSTIPPTSSVSMKIKCPFCRTINSSYTILYGPSELCHICMERPINTLLLDCKHSMQCENCVKSIK